jgi:hypothetical protein
VCAQKRRNRRIHHTTTRAREQHETEHISNTFVMRPVSTRRIARRVIAVIQGTYVRSPASSRARPASERRTYEQKVAERKYLGVFVASVQ